MTSYSSSKEEIEVARTVQPFEEEPRASNKDFDKDLQRDKDVFSPVVLRSRLERKRIFTEKSSGSFTASFSFSETLHR